MPGGGKAVAEARSYVPEVVGVVGKCGVNRELAITHTPQRARGMIREGSAAATKKIGAIRPFVISPPYELKIRCADPKLADSVQAPRLEKVDPCTVVCRADNLCDLPI